MRRTSFERAPCPVARSLDVLGDWWTLLIVRNALHGATRFSEFQQDLGMAKNVLSTRLQQLVRDGVFETRPSPERADRFEYHLTDKGRQLQVVLLALRQWGEDHLFAEGEEITELVDKELGQPLATLEVISKEGHPLLPEEVQVRTGRRRRRARRRQPAGAAQQKAS
jgi:streptomycin 3"-adenylyltransferase